MTYSCRVWGDIVKKISEAFSMECTFSGVDIYSKKPEVVFAFYKKFGFPVLEESSSEDQ